jgi:hypothetical protein
MLGGNRSNRLNVPVWVSRLAVKIGVMSPVRSNENDPIEFLVTRRFPSAWTLKMPTTMSATSRPMPDKRELRHSVEAYRNELSALTPDELAARYSEEHAKALEEARLRREQEERSLFFHQPWASADFSHWSKAAHWTLDEAIALSFGKAPEHVTWNKVQPLIVASPFAGQYARRRDLALRALKWDQLYDPVLPGIFLAWAKRTDIPVPTELTAAVEARGIHIADWKSLYDDMKASAEKSDSDWKEQAERQAQDWTKIVSERDDHIANLTDRIAELEPAQASRSDTVLVKSLGAKERESLLRLVVGMAVAGYRYDPKAERSAQVTEIANDLESVGVPLDADTVRKWLRAAAELLPPK